MEHDWLGTFVQHLHIFGNPDPIGNLPPEQWRYGLRFQLLRRPAGELAHDC